MAGPQQGVLQVIHLIQQRLGIFQLAPQVQEKGQFNTSLDTAGLHHIACSTHGLPQPSLHGLAPRPAAQQCVQRGREPTCGDGRAGAGEAQKRVGGEPKLRALPDHRLQGRRVHNPQRGLRVLQVTAMVKTRAFPLPDAGHEGSDAFQVRRQVGHIGTQRQTLVLQGMFQQCIALRDLARRLEQRSQALQGVHGVWVGMAERTLSGLQNLPLVGLRLGELSGRL
mmetsp:Transcript_16301/g.56902  ORF Transcript_16301/g.56902 Transcript_16301/m.56902 type:complete len:224 (+) Transcript_16301:2310-2981(+)